MVAYRNLLFYDSAELAIFYFTSSVNSEADAGYLFGLPLIRLRERGQGGESKKHLVSIALSLPVENHLRGQKMPRRGRLFRFLAVGLEFVGDVERRSRL